MVAPESNGLRRTILICLMLRPLGMEEAQVCRWEMVALLFGGDTLSNSTFQAIN